MNEAYSTNASFIPFNEFSLFRSWTRNTYNDEHMLRVEERTILRAFYYTEIELLMKRMVSSEKKLKLYRIEFVELNLLCNA